MHRLSTVLGMIRKGSLPDEVKENITPIQLHELVEAESNDNLNEDWRAQELAGFDHK